jgi:ribose transport system ATP-binding protein
MTDDQRSKVLEVNSVSKTFAGTRALGRVSLALQPGRIHALLGGNGSGKSTLIKMLAGVQPADDDDGTITVGNRCHRACHFSPDEARAAGLRFVHQDVPVFADLSVAENFALSAGYPRRLGAIDWRGLQSQLTPVLDRFELEIDPRARVSSLRPGQRTMLAIAQALHDDGDGTRVLVLDEPTTSLERSEVDELLAALRRRAAEGQGVLYVSHHLREVFAVADTMTILRDGMVVAELDPNDVSEAEVVELIAGRPVGRLYPCASRRLSATRTVLEVSSVQCGPLREVSLQVNSEEIVGLAGLSGSGGSTLLRAVLGDVPVLTGRITLNGVAVQNRSQASAVKAGAGYVPADRAGDAALPDRSVAENMTVATLDKYWRRWRMSRRDERRDAQGFASRYNVKCRSIDSRFSTLSGGNQQKAILARWLRAGATLLMLDEPTQGVDVASRAEIYAHIRAAATDGVAVLVVSSDLDELAGLCDRILVLRDGGVVREVSGPETDAAGLLNLMQASEGLGND